MPNQSGGRSVAEQVDFENKMLEINLLRANVGKAVWPAPHLDMLSMKLIGQISELLLFGHLPEIDSPVLFGWSQLR